MIKKYTSPFQKVGLLCILFTFLLIQNAFATEEKDAKKNKIINKVSVDNIKPECNKTDSLKITQNKVAQKPDSVTTGTKSNSGASYNILFQVIYRNSFSDIFEDGK